jgi:hypothetical protein
VEIERKKTIERESEEHLGEKKKGKGEGENEDK